MASRNGVRVWTAQQDEWLRNLYPEKSNTVITEIIGRTSPAVQNRAIKLGLRKTEDYMECEKPGCFRPGHRTWNKGASYEAGGRSAETRFKAGRRASNQKPVGTEVVDNYGYRKRKIRDDASLGEGYKNWKFVHVIVWEQHNGTLPKGHIVRFRDLDITNISPDNLVAITRGENAVINRWMAMGSLPEGGLNVLITMARLKMAARKRQEELA